ncbi:hypothetical protein N665_1037s0005 [Sinapis alba]|nr:hypothetical protein N665_1037s0005 [Sinapis alba]
MTPIVKYVESDIMPDDHNKSRKIKKQAARYCISRGRLFRRSFSAKMVLEELHERECGSHSNGLSLVFRVKRARYYWPTISAKITPSFKTCF